MLPNGVNVDRVLLSEEDGGGNKLESLIEEMQRANCYQITCTILEKGVFKSHLITQNFPRNVMLEKHHIDCENLIIDELRNIPNTTQAEPEVIDAKS
jgi:hypothetical protein